jgi:hypothetical protein
MESVNQKKIEFELKRVAKTTANFFQGVDANDLIETLRPELDFHTGTFPTESPVQKSEQRTLESVRAENPDKEIAMNNGVISEIIRDANGNPIMARRIQ